MVQPEEASLKGCLLPIAIGLVMAGALYAVWRAQSGGADDFEGEGAAYFDALVAGEWSVASRLDHADRTVSESELTAAWKDRESRLGDLEAWELHNANPGWDPDGAFVLATVQLTFSEVSGPVSVRVQLRPDDTEGMPVTNVSAVARTMMGETVW